MVSSQGKTVKALDYHGRTIVLIGGLFSRRAKLEDPVTAGASYVGTDLVNYRLQQIGKETHDGS